MAIVLGLVTWLTIRDDKLPEGLSSVAILVPGTVTALYGFNKIAKAIAARNDGNNK